MSTYDKSIEDMTVIQLEKEITIYSGYIQEYSDCVQDLRDEKGRRAEQKVHRLTQDIRRLKILVREEKAAVQADPLRVVTFLMGDMNFRCADELSHPVSDPVPDTVRPGDPANPAEANG